MIQTLIVCHAIKQRKNKKEENEEKNKKVMKILNYRENLSPFDFFKSKNVSSDYVQNQHSTTDCCTKQTLLLVRSVPQTLLKLKSKYWFQPNKNFVRGN